MNSDYLDELQELEKKATPGPWSYREYMEDGGSMTGSASVSVPNNDPKVSYPQYPPGTKPHAIFSGIWAEDAKLLHALRNAAPKLIEEVKRLREENQRLLRIERTTGSALASIHHSTSDVRAGATAQRVLDELWPGWEKTK